MSAQYVISMESMILTGIGTISKHFWLMTIIQEILHMHHFMVNSDEIFMIDIRAHFNAEWGQKIDD